MDLKRKGKSWVGNIYHQFESIIQDVDEFISKGNVKYVENQVQSVEHDVLPPSGKNVKCKESLVIAKPVEWDHVESVSGIGVTPICVTENQSYVEQGSLDILGNSNPSLPFIEHPCPDFSQGIITDLPSGQGDGVIIWNGSINVIEDNMTRNLIPVTTNSSSTSESSGTCNDNHYTNGWVLEDDISMFKDPNFNEMDFLSAPPLDPAELVQEENCPATNSPVSSDCDAVHRSLFEDGPLRDFFFTSDESFDVSNTVESTKVVIPYFSCDDEEAEAHVKNPNSSNSLKSKSANSTQKDESICSSHVESNGCEYIDSTISSSITAHEAKAMDMYSVESTDINASMTDGSVFSVASSQRKHEDCHEEAQSKLAVTLFKTGNSLEVGVGDLDMETIDLTTNAEKDARRSGVMNCNFIKPTSHRRKDFRYYKSLIQDAMASRKRVSKEYEHLSIWYGDIDMESRHNFEPSFLSSSSSTTSVAVNPTRTQQSVEIPEAEWELL